MCKERGCALLEVCREVLFKNSFSLKVFDVSVQVFSGKSCVAYVFKFALTDWAKDFFEEFCDFAFVVFFRGEEDANGFDVFDGFDWECEIEGGSFPSSAFEPDFAVLGEDDSARDGKAKAVSLAFAVDGLFCLEEWFEEFGLVLGRDSDAVVFDAKENVVSLGVRAELDGAFLGREFDGVANEVAKDLADAVGVCFDGGNSSKRGHKSDLFLGHEAFHVVDDFMDGFGDVDLGEYEFEACGFDARDFKEVCDDFVKPFCIAGDEVDAFLLFLGERSKVAAAEHLELCAHGGHGRAQFMAGDAQKACFCLIDLFAFRVKFAKCFGGLVEDVADFFEFIAGGDGNACVEISLGELVRCVVEGA